MIKLLRITNDYSNSSAPFEQFTKNQSKKYKVVSLVFFQNEAHRISNVIQCCGRPIKFISNFLKIINNIDIIHMHSIQLAFLLIPFVLLKKINKKIILTIHCSIENYNFKNKFYYFFCIIFYKKIIFCSKTSYNSNSIILKKILFNKYKIISNGFNYSKTKKYKPNKFDAKKIIYVGRLTKKKGLYTIVKLIENLIPHNFFFTIVGDGLYKKKIENLKKFNKTKIFYYKNLTRENVYKVLCKNSIYVSNSWTEGRPIAVIEALSLGCFCVLSNIPAHKELSRQFKNIKIFKKNDLNGLKNILLKNDYKLKKENFEKFTVEKMLATYDQEYSKLL